jgi:hypothetical protein
MSGFWNRERLLSPVAIGTSRPILLKNSITQAVITRRRKIGCSGSSTSDAS